MQKQEERQGEAVEEDEDEDEEDEDEVLVQKHLKLESFVVPKTLSDFVRFLLGH
ncbi:hypothetical protein C0995_005228 [Termitomyces sp. Mi166|nr:hypothetical protein C0995_005228 [Termitomyces sp. Mi166\